MNLRSLLRVCIQIAAAASASVLPFAIITLFGQDGFRHFSYAYTVYAFALFLGTLGLDLALARANVSPWYACIFLVLSVGVASTFLSMHTDNPLGITVRLCIIFAAVTGAMGSYLTNRIYFLQTSSAIKSIAWIRITTAVAGVGAVASLSDPQDGIYIVLIQNIIIGSTALYFTQFTTIAAQLPINFFTLPSKAVAALASFLTFSFAGLLQAYERYIAAAIDHPFVAPYLVLSTYLSTLTYIGTGVERSGYAKTQTTRRIFRNYWRLSLVAALIGILVLLVIYLNTQPRMAHGLLAIMAYVTLATTIHIASYFSVAPLVFISFSEADIRRQACTNICVAVMPVGIITTIFLTDQFSGESKLFMLGLMIPTSIWLTSFIRMRFAIQKARRAT